MLNNKYLTLIVYNLIYQYIYYVHIYMHIYIYIFIYLRVYPLCIQEIQITRGMSPINARILGYFALIVHIERKQVKTTLNYHAIV